MRPNERSTARASSAKRYADEFLRNPKEHDTRGPHTVYVSQAKDASVTAEEQEGDSDVETSAQGR